MMDRLEYLRYYLKYAQPGGAGDLTKEERKELDKLIGQLLEVR